MEKCPVMWTDDFKKYKRMSLERFIVTLLIFILLSGFFAFGWWSSSGVSSMNSYHVIKLMGYGVRSEILDILRPKGFTLGQGLDIADALMIQCRNNDIPIELGLAIMKKESAFYTNAVSSANAKGLMQLMVKTFDDYNKALKLNLPPQAIFDPLVNIKISLLHLRDILDELKPKVKSKDELLRLALIAYSGNARGYPEAVRKIQREYEVRFRDGEI